MNYLNFVKAGLLLLFKMLIAISAVVHIGIGKCLNFVYFKEIVEKRINSTLCFDFVKSLNFENCCFQLFKDHFIETSS